MNSLLLTARKVKDKLQREGLIPTRSLDKNFSWLIAPPTRLAPKVCILACFSSNEILSEHTLFLAKSWRRAGYDVILAIASDQPRNIRMNGLMGIDFTGVMVRNNSGYDFGSWATALGARSDLRQSSTLALANDSAYGPLSGFDALLARVDASSADVIAMTDSFEIQHHIQSFLVFYKQSALRSKAFGQFWNSVRGGGRAETIRWSEVPQLRWLEKNGLRVEILFETRSHSLDNRTLIDWRRLVDEGFPFVKAQLLRENPFGVDITGWDRFLIEHGFDPHLVREHLGAKYASSAAAGAAVVQRER